MATKVVVLKNEVVTPTGKKYQVCEFGYKLEDGKVKGMRIFGFGPQKANFDVASKASQGDILDAEFQQNDKGYWEFRSLVNTGAKGNPEAQPATVGAAGTAASATKSGGNWETSEERARRQTYIILQSSISNAIEYLKAFGEDRVDDVDITQADVVECAEYFYNYVVNGPRGDVE